MSRPLIAILITLGFFAGCSSPDNSALGPLQYHEQFSGNVSTLYGTMGPDRKDLHDENPPDFHWRRADSTLDSLSGHAGQVVMINFWATWCGPCLSEMPEIERLSQDLKDSVFIIGVSVDYPGNPFNTVLQFAKDRQLTYQFVVDSAWELYHKYETWSNYDIPHTILIDANGSIQEDILGATNEETFREQIRKLE